MPLNPTNGQAAANCCNTPVETTFQVASGSRVIGRATAFIDGLPDRLDFNTDGATRWEKFKNSITGGVNMGLACGATAGYGLMAVPDTFLGRGDTQDPQLHNAIDRVGFSEGLVGMAMHGATYVAGGVSTIPAGAAGLIAGAVSAPAASVPARQHIGWVANTSSNVAFNVVGTAAAVPLGVTSGALKLPSLAAKYVITGVGALLGGIFGFFVGSVRAIANR